MRNGSFGESDPGGGLRARWPRVAAFGMPLLLGLIVLLIAMAVRVWTATGEGRRPLSVAINPWPGYEFAMLAQELGYFEEEDVEVRMVELGSLGDARRAFERGQVDGMFGTVIEVLMTRRMSDRDPVVTLVADTSDGADVVLARRPASSMADLRGRRIGVESGSLTAVLLARALEASGMSVTDVEVVWMPAIDMPGAFREGQIEGAVCYPPFSIGIQADGEASVLFSSAEIPGDIVDVLAFDASVLASRKEDVRRFQRAFFRAQAFASADPETAFSIMARRQGISPTDFRAALEDGMRVLGASDQAAYFGSDGRLRSIFAKTARELVALGELPPSTSEPGASAFVETGGE
ncbi:MAG: ABC transporter substrate-binding protein [Phycisphaerales bacterium]|nr:ABC transporter substrate-binding protein [Phycisphaerales bacterium]